MALAANLARASRNRGINAYAATTSVTYYAGAFVALDVSTGKAVLWSDAVNNRWLGVIEREHPLTGYGISTVVDEVNVNESGLILTRVSVTGVTAITDVGKFVYATDDTTLTLTATVNTGAIGRIVRWYSTTFCDVELFTPEEYLFE